LGGAHSGPRYRPPIVDYFLALHASQRPGRVPEPFRARGELGAFREFLRGHRLLTVSSVASEVWKLMRSQGIHTAMWEHHIALMTELNIEEVMLRTVDLNVAWTAVEGPVDVAICDLALRERGAHHDVTILTREVRNVGHWRARSNSTVRTLHDVMDEVRSRRSR